MAKWDSGRRFESQYVDKTIGGGEAARCRRRLHPALLVPAIALIAPAALMIVWPSTILLGLAFAGLVIGAFAVITLATSEIAVTDRRFLAQVHGDRMSIPIGQVAAASARRGPFGRRLGWGALTVHLKPDEAGHVLFRGVLDPEPLAEAINLAVKRASREQDGDSAGTPPAGLSR